MTYKVRLHRRAEKSLKKLDQPTQHRIVPVLLGLSKQPRPHGAKKLTDRDGLWRIRIGHYRLVYQIEDEILVVLVIDIMRRTTTSYK